MKKESRPVVDDIVDRLEYASMSTPEISLLREAAAYIRDIRKQNEMLEQKTSTYVFGETHVVDEEGEIIAVIEADVNRFVIQEAIRLHINDALERFFDSENR